MFFFENTHKESALMSHIFEPRNGRDVRKSSVQFSRNIAAVLLVGIVTAALSLAGTGTALATSGASLWCPVTANSPYKSVSGQAVGTGTWGICHDSDNRKAVAEIHHVSGWWHPYVAGYTKNAVYGSGNITASGCYPSQTGYQASYFNQVRLQNNTQEGDWVISADGSFKIGC